MRIAIHDYPGHAFPIQLSRWFASQGHEVLHVYSADLESPRGQLKPVPNDPPSLTISPVSLGTPLPKYDLVRRYFHELRFARRLSARIRKFSPDAILSGNAPIEMQRRLRDDFNRTPFIFWVQDIYSIAIRNHLRSKLPVVGDMVASWFAQMEFRTMARSDGVVVITEDFRKILTIRGVDNAKITTIPNWAPLPELPQHSRDNPWARERGLVDRFVLLYSGTLGLKHDPSCLVELARSFAAGDDVAVVVISQGLGRRMLEEARVRLGLTNLLLFDYQPFERLPEVVASADVLMALLEPEASVLSVPSKVLTYFAAGRPMLCMMPPENQAARVIEEAGAGEIAAPGATADFVARAHALRNDADRCRQLGKAARGHAERAFDIDAIGERFLETLQQAGAPAH